MTAKRVFVKIQPKKGSEEAFFAERDQRALSAAKNAFLSVFKK